MRCAECGHDLAGLAPEAECPECGMFTPASRRLPQPSLPRGKVVWRLAWPILATLGFEVLSICGGFVAQLPGFALMLVFAGTMALLVAPINAGSLVMELAHARVPERTLREPVLFVFSRGTVWAVSAALGAAVVTAGIASGACLLTIRTLFGH